MEISEQQFYRVIDANLNRAKEGLRVCEDVCRFVLDKKVETRAFKNIRHDLTTSMLPLKNRDMINARNIQGDVGQGSTALEFKRKDISAVFMANLSRVKESTRVLEEFIKLFNKKSAQQIKSIRYKIYALEKKIITSL